MHILVTGGAGYIGSHTVRVLLRCGYEVTVLDNLVDGHRESLVNFEVEFIEGDIADELLLDDFFSRKKVDVVMHFAAFGNVGESIEDPLKYYTNNVAAPLVLLKAMCQHNVQQFILSSTCATYGIPKEIPITEKEAQNPINPYGASKLMLEHILKNCEAAWGLRSVYLRYFNAAGCSFDGLLGEDHMPELHLIPLVLMAISGQRDSITVYGEDYPTKDGTCVRDYIHVEDLADAHLKALQYLIKGGITQAFNLGSGVGLSVKEIIEAAARVSGKSVPVRYGDRREGDPPILIANTEKAQSVLGWKAEYTDADTIVGSAWEWHKSHPCGYRANIS